jgi:hypothetical protein
MVGRTAVVRYSNGGLTVTATNVVIIPYYSGEEIIRYLKLADQLMTWGPFATPVEFLLASSPCTEPSRQLYDRFSQIAVTQTLACRTPVFGYPQGPTAMFWDCLDHIAATSPVDGGFCLWLESDMVPVKRHWLDQLAAEWAQHAELLVMGCFVPLVCQRRLLRRAKVWAHEHINGGACYAKQFARQIPRQYREGVFDLAIFPYLKQCGRYRATQSISFSTLQRCPLDAADPRRMILHGYLQDKDLFQARCLALPGSSSAQTAELHAPRRWTLPWHRARKTPEYRRARYLEAIFRAQRIWSHAQFGTP